MDNRDQWRRGAADASDAANAKVEEHSRYGSPAQPLAEGKARWTWAYVRQVRIFANRNNSENEFLVLVLVLD